jgi:hypothetical protein
MGAGTGRLQVWSGLCRDFREGKIKDIMVRWSEVFEEIDSEHQYPKHRCQHVVGNVLITPQFSCSLEFRT